MNKLVLTLLLAAVAANAFGMQEPVQPSKTYRHTGTALKAVGTLGALGISTYYSGILDYPKKQESEKQQHTFTESNKEKQKEKKEISIEKVTKDGSELFFKSYPSYLGYDFYLSVNGNATELQVYHEDTDADQEDTDMEGPRKAIDVKEIDADVIARAFVDCREKNKNTREDLLTLKSDADKKIARKFVDRRGKEKYCELRTLEIIDPKLRHKGYGSLFLRHIINYLKSNTDARTIKVEAGPLYKVNSPTELEQALRKLDSFYRKNGFRGVGPAFSYDKNRFKIVRGISGTFEFNLRDNKI